MKVKQAIPIILTMLCLNGFGQNLVPNWSFEDTLYTPNTNGIMPADAWFSVGGSPEYFHPDNLVPTNVAPNGAYGYQEAYEGQAYAGISAYVDWGPQNTLREFIGVKLSQPLLSGREYCVSFRVSLPESCNYAITSLGASFSVDSSFIDSIAILVNTVPDVENSSSNVLDETDNWMLIQGSFIANGGEEFMTIGNFRHDSISLLTTVAVGDTSTPSYAYYYIDAVAVVEQACELDTQFVSVPNVFTPNSDGLNDVFEISTEGYESGIATIYNRWGQKLYEFNPLRGHWDGYTQAGVQVPEGVYFYSLSCLAKDAEPFVTKGSIQLIR